MSQISNKVKMKLVGEDGNAFAILARFQNSARKQGWSKEDIDKVLSDAQSGDYNHLLCVISDNVDEPYEEDEEDEEDEDEEEDDDYDYDDLDDEDDQEDLDDYADLDEDEEDLDDFDDEEEDLDDYDDEDDDFDEDEELI